MSFCAWHAKSTKYGPIEACRRKCEVSGADLFRCHRSLRSGRVTSRRNRRARETRGSGRLDRGLLLIPTPPCPATRFARGEGRGKASFQSLDLERHAGGRPSPSDRVTVSYATFNQFASAQPPFLISGIRDAEKVEAHVTGRRYVDDDAGAHEVLRLLDLVAHIISSRACAIASSARSCACRYPGRDRSRSR